MGTNWYKPPPGTDIDWAEPLAQRLIAALAFNKGGGTSIDNLAAGDVAAFSASQPTWVSTDQGASLSFSGTLQFLSLPANLAYRPAGGFSMAARVRFGLVSTAEQEFIRIDDGSTNRIGFIGLAPTTNLVRCLGFTSTLTPTATSTTVMTVGPWYDIVGTFDGVNSKVYVNGLLEGTSTTATGTLYRGSAAVAAYVGANAGTQFFFNGQMAQALIWGGRILKADEVLDLYENPWRIYRSPGAWPPAMLWPGYAGAGAPTFRRTIYNRAGSRGVT